jgi:hypothetical protein
MDPELRDLLAGVNQDALTILADNDIFSVDDAKMLSATDLDNLGIKLGSRNKILKLLVPTLSPPPASLAPLPPPSAPPAPATPPPLHDVELSPVLAIEGGRGAVDGLEDFLKAAKCEDWLVRAATWCKENGAETLDELLQCQPSTRTMFVEALTLPVVKREQLERQLAERLREQSSSADDHSTIPKNAAENTPAAEVANKFLPDLPTFVFGDRSLYEDGILARVGNLSRSVQHEFEENERGIWLPELRYVTEQPAREAYPSTKGEAPSDALVPSYTRDLGRTGWTLSNFHEAQPTEGNGPGQIPERLSLAETAVLRTYTGPWFQAINFYLRYLPEVRCCDASPYYEHYNPRRCFLAEPGHEDVCHFCDKPKSKHFIQPLDSWATSAALLVGGILKLRVASTPMTVYRGVKEQFIRLPESFGAPHGGAFACGVEPAPMSTTEAKEVAQSYAGDDFGSLFQIEFDAANRGAHATAHTFEDFVDDFGQ